jgi:hypothetical protein
MRKLSRNYCVVGITDTGDRWFCSKSLNEHFMGTIDEARDLANFLKSNSPEGYQYIVSKFNYTDDVGRKVMRYSNGYHPSLV